jgi:hypothetical protein
VTPYYDTGFGGFGWAALFQTLVRHPVALFVADVTMWLPEAGGGGCLSPPGLRLLAGFSVALVRYLSCVEDLGGTLAVERIDGFPEHPSQSSCFLPCVVDAHVVDWTESHLVTSST